MCLTKNAQSGRTALLAHLDQHHRVESERTACLQHRFHRGEVDRVLPLVVGAAAPVPTLAALLQHPGVEALSPVGIIPTHDIAVAIEHYRRKCGVFSARGNQEGPVVGFGVGVNRAVEAQGREARHHVGVEVLLQHRGALGRLALGRVGDPARQVLKEAAALPIGVNARQRAFPSHADHPCHAEIEAASMSQPRNVAHCTGTH